MVNQLTVIGVGVGVVLVAGYIAQKKIRDALPAGALNPLSDTNLAYSGVNAVGATITGNKDFSLGAWIWEATHPSQVELERQLTTPQTSQTFTGGASGSWGPMVDERTPFDFGFPGW